MRNGLSEHGAGVTRREAINLLGAGAGLGLLAPFTAGVNAAPAQGLFTSAQQLTLPEGAIIRTVLEDVPPDALANGATLFHEHLVSMGYTTPPTPPDQPGRAPLGGDSQETLNMIVDELQAAARDGLGCIVDGGFQGRRLAAEFDHLRTIAMQSSVHLVMAWGYMPNRYPEDVAERSEDDIAGELASDARAQRWGAFGEIGTAFEGINASERKVLRGLGKAHLATGLPIFTHTDHKGCPQCALDQLDLFESVGVNPRSLCIGHMLDPTPEQDPGWQTRKTIAQRGAFVGFDTVGHQSGRRNTTEAEKVEAVLAMLDAGYEDQLLLSSDIARAFDLKANWGNGFSMVLVQFVPKLRHAGVDDATIRKILVDNPRRFLAFVPKA